MVTLACLLPRAEFPSALGPLSPLVFKVNAMKIFDQTFGARQIGELVEYLERLRESAKDYIVDPKGVECIAIEMPSAEGQINTAIGLNFFDGANNHVMELTPWAEKQLAEMCGIPYRYWEKMEASGKIPLISQNVNAWFKEMSDRRLRTLDNKVRAVVSSRFKALDNYDLLLTVGEAIDGKNIGIHSADVSETTMYLRAIDYDKPFDMGDGSVVHRGILLSNSEVGKGALNVSPFSWRSLCANGMVFGAKAIREIHAGDRLDRGIYTQETIELEGQATFAKVKDLVTATFENDDLFQSWLNDFKATQDVAAPEPAKIVEDLVVQRKVTEAEKNTILNRLLTSATVPPELRGTQYAIIEAVTATARDAGADRKTELERLAAQMVIEAVA